MRAQALAATRLRRRHQRIARIVQSVRRPAPSLIEHGRLRLHLDCDVPTLLALRNAGADRGKNAEELAQEIVTTIARDGLFAAVLDDGGGG